MITHYESLNFSCVCSSFVGERFLSTLTFRTGWSLKVVPKIRSASVEDLSHKLQVKRVAAAAARRPLLVEGCSIAVRYTFINVSTLSRSLFDRCSIQILHTFDTRLILQPVRYMCGGYVLVSVRLTSYQIERLMVNLLWGRWGVGMQQLHSTWGSTL